MKSAFSAVATIFFLTTTSVDGQGIVIRGKITTNDGRQLQGSITVIEGSRNVRVFNVRTDSTGEFSIPSTTDTQHRLIAKADGFVSSECN